MYFKNNNFLDTIYPKQSACLFLVKMTAIFYLFIIKIYGQGDLFIGGNSRPVANAGENIKALSKGSIFLDGSKSFVGDGSKIKYQWIFVPGLAEKKDNDFTSEIKVENYGSKYLKSVETYKPVLNLKISDNLPGTKLEVVLSIRDRIGFEDTDTIIVEYFDSSIKAVAKYDTLTSDNQELNVLPKSIDSIQSKKDPPIILVQGLLGDNISINDAHIINSIIKDQIRKVGFNYIIFLNKDIKKVNNTNDHKIKCKSNACVSRNARALNADYAITWEFAKSVDIFYLRIFNIENHDALIDEIHNEENRE